jgi:DNA-directed RNA polymerase specialized sigma24 family protein
MSDKELFNGLKRGERKSIVLIYDQYLPKVSRWIKNNSGTQEDAYDIFQETLETILLKVESLSSSLEGLLIVLSKRKWIDKLRKSSTSKKTAEAVELENYHQTKSIEDTNQEYYKYKLMEKYFVQLSETCQKVMSMMKEGISVQEIVTTLSLSSANTLYRRKAACIERWTSLIKKDSLYKTVIL